VGGVKNKNRITGRGRENTISTTQHHRADQHVCWMSESLISSTVAEEKYGEDQMLLRIFEHQGEPAKAAKER